VADAARPEAGAADSALDSSSGSPCESGAYAGMLTGLYTSHLTTIGIPIPVTGNVAMTLDPATASYDSGSHAFVMGAWNAAEALAGNDGGSPGPDGGPIADYLSDSGYLGAGDYRGQGMWSAEHP